MRDLADLTAFRRRDSSLLGDERVAAHPAQRRTAETSWLRRAYSTLLTSARDSRVAESAGGDRRIVQERRSAGRIMLVASPACSPEETAVHAAAAAAGGNLVTFLLIEPPDAPTSRYLETLRVSICPGRFTLFGASSRSGRPHAAAERVVDAGALVCATPWGVYEADGSFSWLHEPSTLPSGWTEIAGLYARASYCA